LVGRGDGFSGHGGDMLLENNALVKIEDVRIQRRKVLRFRAKKNDRPRQGLFGRHLDFLPTSDR
jgi:hypothetical protein